LDQESDEPDYRVDGTLAHEVASEALRNNLDAWEFVTPGIRRFRADHVEAVQKYIDFVWNRLKQLRERFNYVEMEVEQHVTHPDEPAFYGTIDVYFLAGDEPGGWIYAEVIDYKHGVGVAVDVIDNGQLKYYAHGLQCRYPGIETFNLVIVQPRGFHRDGIIREWSITGKKLSKWASDVLLPGIRTAQEGKGEIVPGPWCRFCPVKIVCPVLGALSKAAATAPTSALETLSNDALGREFELGKAVEIYLKAVYTEMSRRALSGQEGPWKIVRKKADRQWIPGYQAPRMSVPMSPKQAEDRLENGKQLTAEFAHIPPDPGVTVVGIADKRQAIVRTAIDFPNLVCEDE
jgi:hypothetical protein